MTVVFREEDKFIQCVSGGVVVARIAQDTGEVVLVRDEIPARIPSMDLSAIYCKAEEVKEELGRNIVSHRLYVLPNGDGIELSRVFAVHYLEGFSVECTSKVKIEYATGTGVLEHAGTSWVRFDNDEAALAFRDELIKLVNSKGQPIWKPDQIEAAPDGNGFGDWYQRYRVWNRDKTVVLLHTDVLKDAIEFLNKAEN